MEYRFYKDIIACCTNVAYAMWCTNSMKFLDGHKHNYEGNYISDRKNIDKLRDGAISDLVKNNRIIDEAIIAIEQQAPNYCHFLTNTLPQVIKMQRIEESKTIIMSDPTDYSLEIFRLLGINSKIVSARNRGLFVRNAQARYRYPNKDKSYVEHKELASIQHEFDRYKFKDISLPEKIYIERKTSNNGSNRRRIEPIQKTHEIMVSKGYKIIYLEDLNIKTKIQLFYNAKKIVTIHGAGLGNIIFCNNECEIIEARNSLGMPKIFIELAKELKIRNYKPIELDTYLNKEDSDEIKRKAGNNSNNVLPLRLNKKLVDLL